jgi:phage shock protein A
MLVVSVALLCGEAPLASAVVKPQTSAQEKAATLRAQLTDVETKQAELQTRLQTLDEKLKPENIESALAGVGSLHPEDLRAQLRRQLEIERNGVQKQLDLLNTSHSRLETALAQAEADAYRQSALPVTTAPVTRTSASSSGPASGPTIDSTALPRPRRSRKKKTKKSKRTATSAARFAG